MAKFEVDYDTDNDDLLIYTKKRKTLFSLEYGGFDLDVDENGEIVGVEFEDASKFLYELLKSTDLFSSASKVRSFLKDVGSCRVETQKVRKGIIVRLFFEYAAAMVVASLPIPEMATKKEIQKIYSS